MTARRRKNLHPSAFAKAITDEGHRGAARPLVFRRQEAASQKRMHAEHVEIVGGSKCSPDALGASRAGEVHGSHFVSGEAGKTLIGVAEVFVIEVGKFVLFALHDGG